MSNKRAYKILIAGVYVSFEAGITVVHILARIIPVALLLKMLILLLTMLLLLLLLLLLLFLQLCIVAVPPRFQWPFV